MHLDQKYSLICQVGDKRKVIQALNNRGLDLQSRLNHGSDKK
jgi:hypothetical protein